MLKLTRNKGERIIIIHEASGDLIALEVFDISSTGMVGLELVYDSDRFQLDENKYLGLGDQLKIRHASGESVTINMIGLSRSYQARLGISADRTFLIDREEIYKEKLEVGTNGRKTRAY